MKLDYKKDFKDLYLPKSKPTIIDVPSMKFLMLYGEGDPNIADFSERVEALYSLAYVVKMSYKSKDVPEGYYEYSVFPLEGIWDLKDKSMPSSDKSNYAYNIMIRQPEFLTEELFKRFVMEKISKKNNKYIEQVKLETIHEGLCCQMLHIGSYDSEPDSFSQMKEFCVKEGYKRLSLTHREIYISDPRKVAENKRKTVLRFKIGNPY